MCLAQEVPRLELSAGAWRTALEGELQSGILPIDLRSDLALRDQWQFYGTALIRMRGRHRIVLEGSPLRYSGRNLLSRNVSYNGRTYLAGVYWER